MGKKKKISFARYLKIVKWSLGFGFKYSQKYFTIIMLTEPLLSLKHLIYSFIFANIIDDAINLASSSSVTMWDIVEKLIIIFVFEIVFMLIKALNNQANRKIYFLSKIYQREYDFTKKSQLGLQTLQDPEVNKLRENAERWLFLVDNLNIRVINMISSVVLFLVAAVYIVKILPILLPVFLIYALISMLEKKYFFQKDFDWQTNDFNTDGKTKNYRLANIISQPTYIEEIAIVGSFTFLTEKFKKFFKKFNKGFFKIIDQQRIYGVLLNFVDIALMLWGYIETFKMLIEGQISVGTTTFYMSTIDSFNGALAKFSSSLVTSNDFVTKLSKVYEFYNLEPKVKDGAIMLPRLDSPPSIEFKNVSFTYPNSKNKIFKKLNLKIKAGEKVAIVGVNGAGKSTLTKLVARLYDPQEGEILINGNNLKDLKIDDWYKNIGLLFQDFKIYDMLTVQENIYIGKTAKKMDKSKVIESARNADAHEFISKYPKKYKTFMNERYENGIQPSKGQKQKIAIARFFYRDAPLAIFDEPTSAIDSESEYKIFNRIYDFFDNKTVIIISHRFSTVRNADRIIVLDDGRIIEEGSHKELLQKNGKYAKAFKLQADGYKE